MAAQDNRGEVEYLLQRCRLMVDFFSQHDPQFTSAEQLRSIIDSTAAAGNVRGMRTIRRDLLSMSEGLAPDDRVVLTALLAEQARDDPFDRAG